MVIPDTGTVDAMNAHLRIENEFHNTFHSFNGSVICPYDIRKMERSKSDGWIKSLFDNHHSAIYAPRHQQDGVFRLS
jgi:UDP-N-acetylmuramyl pentapeptide synthase